MSNSAEFEKRVIPLLDRLFCGAVCMTGDRQGAEDLTHTTMVHAYAQFPPCHRRGNLVEWLFGILHIVWSEQTERRGPAPSTTRAVAEISGPALDFDVLEALPDNVIQECMLTLRHEDRMVVYYRNVEGFSYEDIAAIMGICVGEVGIRLRQGRQQLRSALLLLA